MMGCEDGVIVSRGEASYPPALLDLQNPPDRVYVRGDPAALCEASISVIGARGATPYGIAIAQMAGMLAAEAGITLVSGGARGCDQAAGRAVLDAGGRHVMVLGTGADVIYPSSSRDLEQRILEGAGCIVSLEPWGTPVQRWSFPKRNRIIAALSRATFVAEAGIPSGTFSTAEAANGLGRELLAAPGSIFAPECRGSNYLIANGATCISDEETLEVAFSRIYGKLRFPRAHVKCPKEVPRGDQAIVRALCSNPMRAEELSVSLGLEAMSCLRRLSALEAEGTVQRLRDGRYALTRAALHALTRLGHNG